MSELLAPALTYELNVLASALGRFAANEADNTTLAGANEVTEFALTRLSESQAVAVPHTMPELLGQAINFDTKLIAQLNSEGISSQMKPTMRGAALSVVGGHKRECSGMLIGSATQEVLISPASIAEGYGTPGLDGDIDGVLTSEIDKWGSTRDHPAIPEFLAHSVSQKTTEDMINFFWRDIYGLPTDLKANIYLTDDDSRYHLFWSPVHNGLDYATPAAYDRATQLSFDIPHNVAHLAHLALMGDSKGVGRFRDLMDERAYFEAVAVLSEHEITEICKNEPERLERLTSILSQGSEKPVSIDNLTNWIIADRSYEFKLRAARLYADKLSLEGHNFNDIVQTISKDLAISESNARAETLKYLPWTGLGAVYTLGYNALLNAGLSTVPEAITGANGVVTTWEKKS